MTRAQPAPTPGTYLRLRREASGLTIREVAFLLADTRDVADRGADMLAAVERDEHVLAEPALRALQRAFAFDAYIYLTLAGADLPLPDICRSCGCSWADACNLCGGGICTWSDTDRTLCTACERRGMKA